MGGVHQALPHPAAHREVSWEYGITYRYLQEQGRLIGGNDLWIGAAGLAYGIRS